MEGKKVSWGKAKAKDARMLFFTLLQQCGCYPKKGTKLEFDTDRARLARAWAINQFHLHNFPANKRKLTEIAIPAPVNPIKKDEPREADYDRSLFDGLTKEELEEALRSVTRKESRGEVLWYYGELVYNNRKDCESTAVCEWIRRKIGSRR